MKENLNLIVMLTHNDQTVQNAEEVFEACKDSKAEVWGMKESPLSLERLKKLYARMKECGKITVLETIAYSKEEGLRGAKIAAECECDILMGTMYFDEIHDFCKEHHIKYMPFVGAVEGRPSILGGTIEEIVAEAKRWQENGAFGIDLLGYRYTGDVEELNRRVVEEIKGLVCIAGSINSYQRLDALKKICPWAFTIGGAFFENKFDGTFCEQIDKVCEYVDAAEV